MLLDAAAIALQDECLGFTLAREKDPWWSGRLRKRDPAGGKAAGAPPRERLAIQLQVQLFQTRALKLFTGAPGGATVPRPRPPKTYVTWRSGQLIVIGRRP
jgi:hypothetical protein